MKRFERSHKMGIGVSLRAAFLFLAVMLFACLCTVNYQWKGG